METLSNLECFVRAAEAASFSEAARRLGLTPAAVSRNVAMLEKNLGARLFQRSTRRLHLTEAGERLLAGIGANLDGLQAALADVSTEQLRPTGVLKVSLRPTSASAMCCRTCRRFWRAIPAYGRNGIWRTARST